MALYKSLNMLQTSSRHLFEHLQKAEVDKQAMETLFLDIAGSDGNISIKQDEFSRLCLERSDNSLYGQASAKICWVVSKETKSLLRSEGVGYALPLNSDDIVAVDVAMHNIEIFQVYRSKDEVLVIVKQKSKTPISFIVYGVPEKQKKKKTKKISQQSKKVNKSNKPNATQSKKREQILGPPMNI